MILHGFEAFCTLRAARHLVSDRFSEFSTWHVSAEAGDHSIGAGEGHAAC